MSEFVFYGIRNRATGEVVRVEYGVFRGVESFSLIEDGGYPIWHVSDINIALRVLNGVSLEESFVNWHLFVGGSDNPASENGSGVSYESPANSDISPETHEVIKLEVKLIELRG